MMFSVTFFSKKWHSPFVVFVNMCTFAVEKLKVMQVNYYITQARDEELMPSGSHVCQSSIRSHSRCYR